MGARRGRTSRRQADWRLWKWAGCIAVVALSALALIWPHLEMVKLSYKISRLEARREHLSQEGRVLRIEAATLRQLDRIESIAREKLKMVFPSPDQVVYVRVPPRRWKQLGTR